MCTSLKNVNVVISWLTEWLVPFFYILLLFFFLANIGEIKKIWLFKRIWKQAEKSQYFLNITY